MSERIGDLVFEWMSGQTQFGREKSESESEKKQLPQDDAVVFDFLRTFFSNINLKNPNLPVELKPAQPRQVA